MKVKLNGLSFHPSSFILQKTSPTLKPSSARAAYRGQARKTSGKFRGEKYEEDSFRNPDGGDARRTVRARSFGAEQRQPYGRRRADVQVEEHRRERGQLGRPHDARGGREGGGARRDALGQ